MCTVTFIARKNGYALGMNRDEKLTRVKALPPARHHIHSRAAIFPSEPGGGTWIGVNEAGVTFALVNWYSIATRVSKDATSRGEVVRSALEWTTANEVGKLFARFPLAQTNPFRLVGIFPQTRTLIEWRWNLSRLKRVEHDWQRNIWISSGFDEAGAQKTRHTTFWRSTQNGDPQTEDWLRNLHASHEPSAGPYSVCMHRNDAASVSFTQIEVDLSSFCARLRYLPCAPCCQHTSEWKNSELRLAAKRT